MKVARPPHMYAEISVRHFILKGLAGGLKKVLFGKCVQHASLLLNVTEMKKSLSYQQKIVGLRSSFLSHGQRRTHTFAIWTS
jgi:hypothetical protein